MTSFDLLSYQDFKSRFKKGIGLFERASKRFRQRIETFMEAREPDDSWG